MEQTIRTTISKDIKRLRDSLKHDVTDYGHALKVSKAINVLQGAISE